MKKSIVSALFLITALVGAQMAHGLEITELAVAIPLEAGIYLTALVVAPTATTAGAVDDDKQVYYAELRDDAVEEVANGGAPSAILSDAIHQIRAQTGTTASEQDLALDIVKAIN